MGFTIEKRPNLTPASFQRVAKRTLSRELRPVQQKMERGIQSISSTGRFRTSGDVVVTADNVALEIYLDNAKQPVSPKYSTSFTVHDLLLGLDTYGFRQHVITPRKPGGVLHFVANGEDVFTKRVTIPYYPPQFYRKAILKQGTPEFRVKARNGLQTTLEVMLR